MPGIEDLRQSLVDLIDEGSPRCRVQGVHALIISDADGAVIHRVVRQGRDNLIESFTG